MMSKTDSTTDDDCRFESPWLATALTRSFFVTVGSHLPLGTRRVAQRQTRLHDHAAGRRLGAESFAAELRVDVRGRTPAHEHVVAIARRSGGRRRARRRGASGLADAAGRRFLHVVLLLAQTNRELLGRVGILERADLHAVSAGW